MLFICNTHHFTECESCVSSTRLHKHDGFHKEWMWLDSEEDGSLCSCVIVGVELHAHAACSVDRLFGSSRGEAGFHAASKTFEDFFHVGGHDKQNILYLELVLFSLKCEVSK